jgi:phosphocarrier protein HPr
MGLMMLGASQGTTLRLTADGPQAVEAIAALTALVDDLFGEGE